MSLPTRSNSARDEAFDLLDLHAPGERTEDAAIVHALIYVGDQLARLNTAIDQLAPPQSTPLGGVERKLR